MKNQAKVEEVLEEVEATDTEVEATDTEVETKEAIDAVQDDTPQFKTDEVIDVEWEKVEQIYRVNEFSKQLDEQLADLCLRYEKTKQNILKRTSECEVFLFNAGSQLKDDQGIDPQVTYELKLPKKEGEKAFFVRKDA